MNPGLLVSTFLIACLFAPTAVAGAETAPLSAGLLIEAESFSRREPNDNTFAAVAKSPRLHGGAGLAKFFVTGHVSYRVRVDRAAAYFLWVRYSANRDQSLSFLLPAGPNPQRDHATKTMLPGTGNLDTCRWARLGSVQLAAGSHQLVVFSAPLRLDCFWLGPRDEPPPDPSPTQVDTHEHLANPIEAITPAWLAETDGYELPAWYDAIRVCAHTRLSWPMRSRLPDTWAHTGRLLHSIGFEAISRHIKSGSEGAWWPSSVGAILPEAVDRNFAREIIDEAHANGCRILVYHRHMEDAALAREHPEWQARDARGPKNSRRGPMLCLHSPYADFLQTRLIELAKMGADGFYFDEVHMVKPICHCGYCREGFAQATGRKYPATDDSADPGFQKAIEYRNTILERVFRRWRAALHAVNPQVVMLISSNTYPAMHDRHTTHRLWRAADAMKSEFNLPVRLGNNRIFAADRSLALPEVDARIALGYTLDRDACDGRPPHVWAHGLPDAKQMMFAAAGMITHGQIANLDHRENTIPDRALFGPAVELGTRVAPAFAGARPLRWAAVHFSEFARDHYLPDEATAWKQVLYPIYGAFTTLLRRHLPVGIVTDSQLEQGRLDGYRVLFLPAPQHLTERMRAAVASFRTRGGLVVEQSPAWTWHRPGDGMRDSAVAFLAAIAPAAPTAPVEARGGPDKLHVVSFLSRDGRRVTVSLVNDFSWVQTGRAEPRPAKGKTDSQQRPARATPAKAGPTSAEGENEGIAGRVAHQAPAPCSDVRLIVRLPGRPAAAREWVTAQSLRLQPLASGYAIDLPAFACLSVVTIELAETP